MWSFLKGSEEHLPTEGTITTRHASIARPQEEDDDDEPPSALAPPPSNVTYTHHSGLEHEEKEGKELAGQQLPSYQIFAPPPGDEPLYDDDEQEEESEAIRRESLVSIVEEDTECLQAEEDTELAQEEDPTLTGAYATESATAPGKPSSLDPWSTAEEAPAFHQDAFSPPLNIMPASSPRGSPRQGASIDDEPEPVSSPPPVSRTVTQHDVASHLLEGPSQQVSSSPRPNRPTMPITPRQQLDMSLDEESIQPVSSPPPIRSSAMVVSNNDTPENLQLAIQRSNFTFLSEQESVPTQLSKLQETTLQRRHEFQTAVHALECRLAALTADLATERVERERALQNVIPDIVYGPLCAAMDEIHLERDKSRAAHTNWMQLEGRVSVLDAHMTHSTHVQLPDNIKTLLSPNKDVPTSVQQQIKACDKTEATLFRRLDDLAGSMARRYVEARATRAAACGLAARHMKELEDLDPKRADAFLQQLAVVRVELGKETEMRMTEDERVWRLLETRKKLIQRAILESVGGEID